LDDQLGAVVGPAQTQAFPRRNHRTGCAFALDLLTADTELHGSHDRDLHKEEVVKRARRDLNGWADAQDVE
jgi:hypothetical protein